MQKSKQYTICATLFYVSAVCFLLAAIVTFIGRNTAMGIVWLCLGGTELCLGSLYLHKSNEHNDTDEL